MKFTDAQVQVHEAARRLVSRLKELESMRSAIDELAGASKAASCLMLDAYGNALKDVQIAEASVVGAVERRRVELMMRRINGETTESKKEERK